MLHNVSIGRFIFTYSFNYCRGVKEVKNMNKILPFLIVGILVLSGLGAAAIVNKEVKPYMVNDPTTISHDDELDQYQTEVEDGIPVGNFEVPSMPRYNWSVAQSFVPTKEVLTRVSLLLARNTTPPTVYPIIVTIRNSLTGDNLAVASVEPQEIEEFPNYSWVEFDFDDLIVSVNQIYYIVSYTKNVTDNAYVWGVNGSNLYPNGQVFFSFDDGVHWDGGPPLDLADMCFMTYGIKNFPPYSPSRPTGPTHGTTGTPITFSTNTTDPDNDNVRYGWDWDGDNTVDEWTNFISSGTTVSTPHAFGLPGMYNVKVKAEDMYGARQNVFSLPFTIVIYDNKPPFKPRKPSGEISGKPGVEYTYTSRTRDLEQDQVYYLFDWDDGTDSGWLGPYDSGETCEASHAWEEQGDYSIKVKAKDIYDHESVWSDPLSVSMPKNKAANTRLFLQFLQNHPLIYQLLQRFLKL